MEIMVRKWQILCLCTQSVRRQAHSVRLPGWATVIATAAASMRSANLISAIVAIFQKVATEVRVRFMIMATVIATAVVGMMGAIGITAIAVPFLTHVT
jgi:hypothetical protein